MYICLIKWTEQGVRGYRASVDRTNAATEIAVRLGCTMMSTYWTMGPYDLMAMGDFPDDETASAFVLALGAQGNVRTTTMRAFSADEIARVIDKLRVGP
jgi:uncharacterized protein with GYD domain